MKKKTKTSITKEITIGFIAVIGLIGAIIFFFCQYYSLNSAKKEYKHRAVSCAKSTASVLFNTDFNDYLKNGKNENYKTQVSIINSICKNFNLKYIYVYIPNMKDNELTTLFYVDGKHKENVKNRDLGTKIHWKITQQEKDAYNGLENSKMYSADNQMGHTITSYAPVYNKEGQVTALIGADLDFNSVYKRIIKNILKVIFFVTVCLLLIYIALISYLRVIFIKPIINISKKMANFIKNDPSNYTPIEINSNDELEIMANSFNKMADDINRYLQKISETQRETIFSLAKLAQSRDDDTGKHLERVQQYCEILVNKLKENKKYEKIIDDTFIKNLVNASTLHDIGKVGISDLILLKKEDFTDDEYAIMKKHTTIGYETLKEAYNKFNSNEFLEMGMSIALYHHERWDGKGYPKGIKGEEIPLEARIMAIADVYDALGTKRVYKPAFSQEKCIKIIKEGRGTQFDPDIVDAFLEVADSFYKVRCSMEDKN